MAPILQLLDFLSFFIPFAAFQSKQTKRNYHNFWPFLHRLPSFAPTLASSHYVYRLTQSCRRPHSVPFQIIPFPLHPSYSNSFPLVGLLWTQPTLHTCTYWAGFNQESRARYIWYVYTHTCMHIYAHTHMCLYCVFHIYICVYSHIWTQGIGLHDCSGWLSNLGRQLGREDPGERKTLEDPLMLGVFDY